MIKIRKILKTFLSVVALTLLLTSLFYFHMGIQYAYGAKTPKPWEVAQTGTTSFYVGKSDNNKKSCSIETIRKDFLDGATAKNCWYCNIVSTMTNSFLTAVAESNGVIQTLALLILRYGFLIWLAYYILQQVSSLAPIKTTKMLQDILMMGFKVLLATLAVRQGIPLLTEFFIDPVMLLGVDYGQEMLDGLMEANIGTTQTPTPGTFGGGSFDGNGATSRW